MNSSFFENFFFYQSTSPLIFTSGTFWIFFAIVLLLFSVTNNNLKFRNFLLMCCSMFFYYKSSGMYLVVLLMSISIDFVLGNLIYKSEKKSTKHWLIAICVIINLSLLGFFKYAHFITESVNQLLGTSFEVVNFITLLSNAVSGETKDLSVIFLPVGISFYTFQSLSYAIDIYREEIKPVKTLLDYAFFVSFFPQLVAGPIVRASEFLPQIHKPFNLSQHEFTQAIYLILAGLAKKIIISDYISSNFVDRVFSTPNSFTGFENLVAIYGYSMQIYCDFSGYTDIAIGVALLLGFRLTLNFNKPYSSINITDFWRRWHMSLSRWLKDYLYISLGGNRNGKFRTYLNLFLTMLLGGLWHGAHIKFIIWGALHGIALGIHKIWMKYLPSPNTTTYNIISGIFTFHFVAFCWIFFRADSVDAVFLMLNQIGNNFQFELIPNVIEGYGNIFAVIILGFILHFIPTKFSEIAKNKFSQMPIIIKALSICIIVLIIYQFKTSASQPFIYFQF